MFSKKRAFDKIRNGKYADQKIIWRVVKKKQVPEISDLPTCIKKVYSICVDFEKENRSSFEELGNMVSVILKENKNKGKIMIGRSHSDLEDYWLNLKEVK